MSSLRPLVFPPLHHPTSHALARSRISSRVGAVTGMQVFLTICLLLLLYGSVAGERSASVLFGDPDAPGLGLAASMVIGLASAAFASVFAILVRVAGAHG